MIITRLFHSIKSSKGWLERDHQGVVTPGNMDQNVIHGFEPADLNNVNRDPYALICSTSPDIMEIPTQKPTLGEQESQIGEDEDNNGKNAHNQLVLHDHVVVATAATTTAEVKPLRARKKSLPNYASRDFPDCWAFTVQCAKCFKWRYIYTKEKYEEIREHISEKPFYCETTREWDSNKSCADPPDLTQDGRRLWAMDKPNIAQPPPGWERIRRIRKEGGTKFVDVYYNSPSEMRLRSKIEVEKFLEKHPEYKAQGVDLKKFSFEIPRPLQEEYVKKRRPTRSHDGTSHNIDGAYNGMDVYSTCLIFLLEFSPTTGSKFVLITDKSMSISVTVNPISWAPPNGNTGFLGGQVQFAPFFVYPLHVPDSTSSKKPRLMGESDAVIK